MKNNFAFVQLTNTLTGIISLPEETKDKQYPFIIVNTDNNRGLYIKKLEREIDKYKGLKSADGSTNFRGIRTSDIIVFGDNRKFDYRIEMNYVTLNSLMGKNVKVFDLVDDYDKIIGRLETYCKNNSIKRKCLYRDGDIDIRVNFVVEEPKKKCFCSCKKAEKTLVNVYRKPDLKVEKITVHANWVKIGWNQYDIYVDLFGNEFIELEDGDKLFVKEDRFGRRYLAV